MQLLSRAALCGAIAALALSSTAFAIPKASWDDPSDDETVLVKEMGRDFSGDDPPPKPPNTYARDELTQGYADYLLNIWEWTLQNKLSAPDRNAFQAQVVKTWILGDVPTGAVGAFKPLEYRRGFDFSVYNEDGQLDPWIRVMRRNEMVQELRKEAKADPENGRFLLALYDKYNPALAPGEPRLTRTTTNALTDRVVFMINEVIGKSAAKATPQLQKRIADQTAALWPKLSPARREELLKMEEDFRYMEQEGWKYKAEVTREDMRIAWGAELQNSFPAVKPMYLLRKKRLETARRQSEERWARLSPAQQSEILDSMERQIHMSGAANQRMFNSIQRMQMDNYATSLNIIENMKSTPQFTYSVK